MKEQILKIAGVKSIKEFYNKYPSEEDFMKVHGKAFKKAQLGAKMSAVPKADWGQVLGNKNSPLNFNQNQWMQNQLDWSGISPTDKMKINPALTTGYNQQTFSTERQQPSMWDATKPKKKFDFNNVINPANKLIQGVEQLFQEKKQMKKADMWNQVSNVALQASQTSPEEIERKYLRPEDDVIFGEQFNNPKGNIYSNEPLAKNGKKVKGKKASFGSVMGSSFNKAGANQAFGQGMDIASNYAGKAFDYNAGSQIGGAVGDAVKFIPGVGPIVSAVAKPVLSFIGGGLDQAFGPAGKIKKYTNQMNANINNMAMGNGISGVQQQYTSYMEDGGKLRTGGNLRQNQMFDVDKYAMGGELKLYDGSAQQISQNPYLPDGGQTIMFNGASHENGGMDIAYGNSPVEVEGGEPAVKLEDGGGANNLIVFGNLPIHKDLVPLLGDPSAKGKKFKNYIADLSLKENKANKLTEKATTKLADLKIENPMDKLTLNSHKLTMLGADMTLKDAAQKKERAAWLQEAINDVAGDKWVAEDLAKGKLTKAKFGGKITAYSGITLNDEEFRTKAKTPGMLDYNLLGSKGTEGYLPYDQYIMKVEKALSDPTITKHLITTLETYYGQDADDVKALLKKQPTYEGKVALIKRLATDTKVGPYHQLFSSAIDLADPNTKLNFDIPQSKIGSPYALPKSNDVKEGVPAEQEDNKFNWAYAIQSALPYFRPTDAEELDPRQLSGEIYAMSQNQLEPVQAQTYHPELSSPYDISLQDQLNEITADTRGAQRTIGYNPAAQAMIASQAYGAKSKVLADQFRFNQAQKDKVYGENRNLLNQAKLQNLGILDQQYARQSQAKSNTKAITQAALNSIAAKYQQNELENKTLQTYENMYNYRYGNNMRAQNWNGPAMFNTEGNDDIAYNTPVEGKTQSYVRNERGDFLVQDIVNKPKEKKSSSARNGDIVSDMKRL